MSFYNENIGKRLYNLRKGKDLSQSSLVIALNAFYQRKTQNTDVLFSQQSEISNLEKGKKAISPEQLIAYAEYFGVSADSILGIETTNEESFYPDDVNTTYSGVIHSLNYLISAFGEEKIIGTMEIKTSELGYDGIEEHTEIIPVLRFDRIYKDVQFFENPIQYYLNQIIKTIPLKSELNSIDSKAYIQLLKKWADCSFFTIENKQIEITGDDDCPF